MKTKYIILFIFNLLFSLAIILTIEIGNYDTFPSSFINDFHISLSLIIKTIIISIITFITNIIIFKIIDKIKFKNNKKETLNKKFFIIIYICQIITGLLFLITYYPGQNMNDTLYILNSPLGMAVQHPLFYNLLIYIPYTIFYKIFKNMNLAFFLLSLLQLLLISGVITLIIKWFHKIFKNKLLTILLSLYFIFVPIITNYNVTLIKDSIFNILLLSYIPLIYNILSTNGEWIKSKKNTIIATIICTLTSLIRNNGLYVTIFVLVLIFIRYRKHYKNWLIILTTVIIISLIPNLFIKEKPLFQEKAGIPIQQIAYTYYIDGNIDDNDIEYLNKWFNSSTIKDHYSPYSVDTIKWSSDFNNKYFNDNKNYFFKTYFNLLKNNPNAYIKSYILATYGNWNLNGFTDTQSRFLGLDTSDQNATKLFPNLQRKTILPSKIQNILEKYYETTTIYFSSGICLWILLFSISYTLYKRKTNLVLLTLPIIGNFLTLMISSPLSTAFRYSSSYAYILPLFISIILLTKEKTDF